MAVDPNSIKQTIDALLGNKGYRGIRISSIISIMKALVDWVTGNDYTPVPDWSGTQLRFKSASTGAPTGGYVDLRGTKGDKGDQGQPGAATGGAMSYIASPVDGQPFIRYLPILTLQAETGGTYDVARAIVTLGSWTAPKQTITLQIGNRGGFSARWTSDGPVTISASLEAYRNQDSTVTLYARLTNEFQMVAAIVPLYIAGQVTVNGGLTPIAPEVALGAKVFDSKDTLTYPPSSFVAADRRTEFPLALSGLTRTPDSKALALVSIGDRLGGLEIRATNGGPAFIDFHLPGFVIHQVGVDVDGRFKIRRWGTSVSEVILTEGGQNASSDVSLRDVTVRKLVTSGALPTIASGNGANGSATINAVSNDMAGRFTVNVGNSPTVGGILATVTFAVPYAVAPRAVLVTAFSGLAGEQINRVFVSSITATGFALSNNTSAMSLAQAFQYQYVVIA